MNDYDAIPYDAGRAFPETHPGHLAVLGRLFGLESADPQRCRVLELGCASGQNLIPMAWYAPGSSFLGVELARAQARAGGDLIRELGLSNIEILQGDILELPRDLGEFDYILAHGIYSWVPPAVRDGIMALCARRLAPQGIAYISFNTLPGWRRRGMLRDMLRYHTRNAVSPAERLRQAQGFLETFAAELAGVDSESARFLRREIARVRSAHPSYLYHEFLAEVNEPLLFSSFMEQAARHDLQYLGDAELKTMFAAFFDEASAARIERIADPIEREQHMDFLRNREFRGALLCRAGRSLNHEIDIERFRGFAYHADLAPREAIDLGQPSDQAFTAGAELEVHVAQPLTKAALVHLAGIFPDSVSLDRLEQEARNILIAAGHSAQPDRAHDMLEELVRLYVHQAVGLDLAPRRFFHAPGERPAAHRLARVQAGRSAELVTPRHATVRLNEYSARPVRYLDGTRTRAELVRQLVSDLLDTRTLALPPAYAARPDHALLRDELAENCERLIAALARQGLLQAPP